MKTADEHFDYDSIMAHNCIEMLKQTEDQFWRNVLHCAASSYLYNLLTYLNTDVDGFRQRAENQVRSLTHNRTGVQEEKLNTPDYVRALDKVKAEMMIRGIEGRLLAV